MRTFLITIASLAALALAGPATAATKTIDIYASGFSPNDVTITQGDTVTWINKDSKDHQVLADKGQFVSPILHHGSSYSFTFRAAGTYSYKDELYPRHTAKIVVKGLPPSLTLAASQPIVTFGTQVTLSGVVSNHKAGEQVTLWYQPYPQPNLIQRATILTTTGGAWSYIVSPQILTNYQASWNGAYATPTTIQVIPKLTLGRHNGWLIHVYGGRSFAGRAVEFQRLNLATGQWVTLRKVILNTRSAARLVVKLPKGVNRLRVAMSVNQAGAGYLGATGEPITWRQT
ncbi:MAG TPA: cupredoxin domain-containing protein [Gaiellaceae bacterium]|nr:cupredoxin domain-containing protein [Gaiellaceae bacterium]